MPRLSPNDNGRTMRWCIISWCLLWLLLSAGCQQLHRLNLPIVVDQNSDRQLQQAYGAVKKQQYGEALALFEKISQTHKTGIINQYARYGIACTHMSTAETTAEMEVAMSDWVYWFQQMPEKYHHEDPRLLDQVLHNYRVYLSKDAQRTKKWQIERKWFQNELKKKQSQIDELQRKIDAIETIHQDIQEKKRRITPPATEGTLGNS